jgi:hypothetical protein
MQKSDQAKTTQTKHEKITGEKPKIREERREV